ncbi:hypothetical protein V2J09_000545 [Rumex salicifolius]
MPLPSTSPHSPSAPPPPPLLPPIPPVNNSPLPSFELNATKNLLSKTRSQLIKNISIPELGPTSSTPLWVPLASATPTIWLDKRPTMSGATALQTTTLPNNSSSGGASRCRPKSPVGYTHPTPSWRAFGSPRLTLASCGTRTLARATSALLRGKRSRGSLSARIALTSKRRRKGSGCRQWRPQLWHRSRP